MNSVASIYGNKDDLYDRLKRHAYPGKKGEYFTTKFVFLEYSGTAFLNYLSNLHFSDKSDSESDH